jgi:hypothetical protein
MYLGCRAVRVRTDTLSGDLNVCGRSDPNAGRQPTRRACQTSSQGRRRAHSRVVSGNDVVASSAGRSSRRSSITRPVSRSSRIQSPWGHMELDSDLVGPFEPVHAEQRANESVCRRFVVLVRRTQHEQQTVPEKGQRPAGPAHACSLRDPPERIAPDRCAVL